MRILIIDDDEVCAKLVSIILAPYGDAALADSGTNGIRQFTAALAEHRPFDLVCLDIQMPDLDGNATLRCLRAIEAGFGRSVENGATILMITAIDDAKSIFSAFRGQCEGYLVKPIDRDQILAQLDRLGIIPTTPEQLR